VGQFTGNPQGETLPGARCCPKNELAGKWGLKWIFLETGEILRDFIAPFHPQDSIMPLSGRGISLPVSFV